MSKVIRIDPEVFAELQKRAGGFEKPNTVIRRLLGLEPKQERQS